MNNFSRIKSITVKGLFNQFNHHIDFNQEERITILHGVNGVGKTTLLRMINNLFNSRIYSFKDIPFTSFTLKFSDENSIKIEKHNRIINIFSNGKPIEFQDIDVSKAIKRLHWIEKIEDDLFVDHRMEEVFSSEDLIARYGNIVPIKNKSIFSKSAQQHIPVQFIEASRLLHIEKSSDLHRRKEPVQHTVKIYASDLQQRIKSAMADYGKKTQELEQTFPFRLLETSEHHTDEQLKEHIKEHIEALQNKRQQLREIGFLPTTDSASLDSGSIDNLEAHHAAVMSLYVKDSEEKLKVLECLSKKIKLLLNIINSKFQGKELRIDEKEGLIVVGKGGKIDLSLLSSGEQHELVMFYDLIFKVEPNTLVMIDEPELSLHITWQHKFIDELKQIVEHSEFDVLIATHSPTVVGQNSHLMVSLGNNE